MESSSWARGEKASLYARAGIVEYWVASIAEAAVHVYRQPAEDGYQTELTVDGDNAIAPLAQPKASLIVAELFAKD